MKGITSHVMVRVPTLPPPPDTCLGAMTGASDGVCIVTEINHEKNSQNDNSSG